MTQSVKQFNSNNKRTAWLYVVIAFMCLIAVWRVSEVYRQQQLTSLKSNSEIQLNQLANVLESAIAKYQHMPILLASNDRVRRALFRGIPTDINLLNRELAQINRITESSDIYIMDRDGLTIAASNYDEEATFVGKNFSFRPYFQEAIKGREGRYYALGTTSNRRGYFFSYPVYFNQTIVGVAVVKVDLRQFEKRFDTQSYEFLLLDPDNVVFSSSRSDWLYKVMGELSHDELTRIADSRRYKDRVIETLPIVSVRPVDQIASIVELLQAYSDDSGRESFERRSYLKMSQPIQLFGFKVVLLKPLQSLNDEIVLWRAIFAGGVIITALLAGLALLRKRMLQERSDAIEMARHNQAYIREVIQNTQAGLVTLDDKFCIESFNPAVEQIVGKPLSDLIGQPLEMLFFCTPSYLHFWGQMTDKADSEIEAGGRFITIEGELIANSSYAVPVEMTLCELQLPKRRGYLVTFHDMTERKRYEKEITLARQALEERVRDRTGALEEANDRLRQEVIEHKETQEELIQTAKMAVLGQLSAGLNHELNQPLTAIRAFSDNSLKFLEKGRIDQVEMNLQQISQLGHHMGDIIARFKVFARKGDVAPRPISIQSALNGAIRIMSSRMKEGQIELSGLNDCPLMVMGDMVFLEQVIVNILANSVDAIEDAKPQRRIIDISACTVEGSKVQLAIHDTGPGFSQSDLSRLFEPFFTTKSLGVGLGLGLSISQRIVESMGGEIAAQNHPQGGAEFYVTLPAFFEHEFVEVRDVAG
ncbi:ATP-binding protein [Marinomonas balearica]|uniref:C4-dicarboxylate transport sensor protein DctB n=1 Tax=Marinomonas balearica TaxID=491947 RepID=A0A4V3CH72_9GAMM|nr:ATP-binding protein [Marinomonas balearica]TDP00513.1 two-component system C4-dicarboxylate transport sensor histidine kinase DctB [Marinomonas balearica]